MKYSTESEKWLQLLNSPVVQPEPCGGRYHTPLHVFINCSYILVCTKLFAAERERGTTSAARREDWYKKGKRCRAGCRKSSRWWMTTHRKIWLLFFFLVADPHLRPDVPPESAVSLTADIMVFSIGEEQLSKIIILKIIPNSYILRPVLHFWSMFAGITCC